MEKIKNIIKEVCPDLDVESEVALIDGGHIGSLDMVTLVTEINSAYGINVPPEEIRPDNFNSVLAIHSLISRLGGNGVDNIT